MFSVSSLQIIYYDDFYANNFTTSTTENSTTTTDYDDENDDIITISFVTAGVIVAVLAAFILIFIYVRSQRRKIQVRKMPLKNRISSRLIHIMAVFEMPDTYLVVLEQTPKY